MSYQGKLDTPKKGKLDSANFPLFGDFMFKHQLSCVESTVNRS